MKPRGCFSNVTCGGMALILLLALTACGGPPKWVKQGSGAFNEKDTKAFYGVGSVTGEQVLTRRWDQIRGAGNTRMAISILQN